MPEPPMDTARPTGAEPLDFPLTRTCPFHPPVDYATMRTDRPVAPVRTTNGDFAWLITRYDDVRRLLTDPRVSADRTHPGMPFTDPVTPESRRQIAAGSRSLIGLDPPEHGPRRGMLITEFTVRRIQTLRPYIQRVVDDRIDAMLAGPKPVDLVTALCLPVPSTVLCEMLGIPYADRAFFEEHANMQVRRNVAPRERQAAGAAFRAYLDGLITEKERAPGDDILGRLIVRNRETGTFDHHLLIGLTMLLMIAGHESTANMISLGVTALLENPAQLARVAADPAAVAPAVEELLRYLAIVDTMPRVATGDIDVDGVTISAGDGILIGFAAANRDETTFADAATLDVARGARNHVAFGYGVHQCLGQNLARAELEIVYATLFRRIPGIRLATGVDELPFKNDSNVYGIDRLPVTW